MTTTESLITIALVATATMITRFLPFILFPADKKTPAHVQYLGKVLPPAIIGMLIIYCLKDVKFFSESYGKPEIISVLAVVIVHVLKRQVLISIAVGTILYMFLVQAVF